MGYDLVNKKGNSFHINNIVWAHMLKLANRYGWNPPGNILDPEVLAIYIKDEPDPEKECAECCEKWDCVYSTNSLQTVTADDALCMANALKSALADIPDNDNQVEEPPPTSIAVSPDMTDGSKPPIVGSSSSLTNFKIPDPLDFFAGEGKQAVEEFISFCSQGEFMVG